MLSLLVPAGTGTGTRQDRVCSGPTEGGARPRVQPSRPTLRGLQAALAEPSSFLAP